MGDLLKQIVGHTHRISDLGLQWAQEFLFLIPRWYWAVLRTTFTATACTMFWFTSSPVYRLTDHAGLPGTESHRWPKTPRFKENWMAVILPAQKSFPGCAYGSLLLMSTVLYDQANRKCLRKEFQQPDWLSAGIRTFNQIFKLGLLQTYSLYSLQRTSFSPLVL